mmetsp:Transcript_4927/g.11175  ORF Transcript_4927/g.11175 Transcript_4927/m.11175 type:complete len:219 (-) Transcript_4927:1255-1911(-)
MHARTHAHIQATIKQPLRFFLLFHLPADSLAADGRLAHLPVGLPWQERQSLRELVYHYVSAVVASSASRDPLAGAIVAQHCALAHHHLSAARRWVGHRNAIYAHDFHVLELELPVNVRSLGSRCARLPLRAHGFRRRAVKRVNSPRQAHCIRLCRIPPAHRGHDVVGRHRSGGLLRRRSRHCCCGCGRGRRGCRIPLAHRHAAQRTHESGSRANRGGE